MPAKRIDLKVVGIALLPALAVSVVVALIGRMLNVPDSTVDRITQILFFPVFLGACYAMQRRQAAHS